MLPPVGRCGLGDLGAGSGGVKGASEAPPKVAADVLGGPKNGSRPWNHSKNLIILTKTKVRNQSERRP